VNRQRPAPIHCSFHFRTASNDPRNDVQGTLQRLLVNAREVAPEDADTDQLHTAEEEHRGEDPQLEARVEDAGQGEAQDDKGTEGA
jgi:hypothetical protein